VPDGAPGAEGCYLAMPREALLAEIALASHAARCAVIGEDLGTVPHGFRERMSAARILSTRVLAFERRDGRTIPLAEWPRLATACLATHDLPTVLGWWRGADLAEREALGLLEQPEAAGAARAAERKEIRGLLPEATDEASPSAALHGLLATAPCAMLLVQAEDLAGETEAVNLPGTDRERPNWRRRLGVTTEALLETPLARAILDTWFAGRRDEAFAEYARWLPLINHENRQCGLLAAKALMEEGGVIRCGAPRAPIAPLHPATRAGLVEIAKRLDAAVLRWGR